MLALRDTVRLSLLGFKWEAQLSPGVLVVTRGPEAKKGKSGDGGS